MTQAWKRGDKAKLANAMGISRQYLNSLIKGRQRATPERARQLEAEANRMGLRINRLDVLYPEESSNPLIGGHNA